MAPGTDSPHPHVGTEPFRGLTYTPKQGKHLCFPFGLITRGFTPIYSGSLESGLCLLLPVPPCFTETQNNCSDESFSRYCAKLMDSSQKDYTINTKSAIFSRKQVRIMAFLYATPATQNNSLITIAAIPGIPQNRKCCFIYNKLLGMIKQSMPTGWVGALCTAPNEPAFPERQFLIKVNTVLCLIKVNKYFPKSHIVSSSFATFSFFPPLFLLLPLI